MARSEAGLSAGVRLTDHISLGVLTKSFPRTVVDDVLEKSGRLSQRERQMPAHVTVYYVIALGLYMNVSYREVLRCLMEGLRWLFGANVIKITGKSGIVQARKRLGAEPLKQLYETVVKPIATKETKGAKYRHWRLKSIDGSTMDVGDTSENEAAFGRPGSKQGKSAFPQIRFVTLVENGTHVLFGGVMGGSKESEISLSKGVITHLKASDLLLSDRNFFGYSMWKLAIATGADHLWRAKKNLVLPCLKRFDDGSYLSKTYPNDSDRRRDRNGILIRVIEYRLEGVVDAEPFYRLITSILDPKKAPANELAALYHERWEIETSFDELKTHLRGAKIVLRSKTPDLVRQEFYGLLLAHFAIRGLMHEAALQKRVDTDELSFLHAVRVVRRKMAVFAAFSPSESETIPSDRD